MFQTFGGFTSGIGVHYSPSAIVNVKHQGHAQNLIIGQRMLPQKFILAANARPVEVQDFLPSDTRFKVLVFLGSLDETRLVGINALAVELEDPASFLRKYTADGQISSIFDITTIVEGNKEDINYLNLPTLLRPHWSK